MNAKHLKTKIEEISEYEYINEVDNMYITISMSMLEEDKKQILYKALDIKKDYIQSNLKHGSNVVTSELKLGEI